MLFKTNITTKAFLFLAIVSMIFGIIESTFYSNAILEIPIEDTFFVISTKIPYFIKAIIFSIFFLSHWFLDYYKVIGFDILYRIHFGLTTFSLLTAHSLLHLLKKTNPIPERYYNFNTENATLDTNLMLIEYAIYIFIASQIIFFTFVLLKIIANAKK